MPVMKVEALIFQAQFLSSCSILVKRRRLAEVYTRPKAKMTTCIFCNTLKRFLTDSFWIIWASNAMAHSVVKNQAYASEVD